MAEKKYTLSDADLPTPYIHRIDGGWCWSGSNPAGHVTMTEAQVWESLAVAHRELEAAERRVEALKRFAALVVAGTVE